MGATTETAAAGGALSGTGGQANAASAAEDDRGVGFAQNSGKRATHGEATGTRDGAGAIVLVIRQNTKGDRVVFVVQVPGESALDP